jgi:hypothetical protein
MATHNERILAFLRKKDRPAGWSSVDVCDRLGLQPFQFSKAYRAHSDKLMRWGGPDGPDSEDARRAEAQASKLLPKNKPLLAGGQPYIYRYNFAADGLGKINIGKNRENLCPHKSAPHHARGMCHSCYLVWKRQHKDELRTAPNDAQAQPKKKRRVSLKAVMDSIACTACRRRDDEDSLVLCDGCDDAWHIFCMMPKRDEVPSGDWFCHLCLAAAATRRAGLDARQQQQKVRAPWSSSLVGQSVYLCTEEGWRCGTVTACVCNTSSADVLGTQNTSGLSTPGGGGGSTAALQIPTADVEYDVQLDGHLQATTPILPSTIRVSWLWLRQGCAELTEEEAQRLVGVNVRKRFAGHGVFKGKVGRAKFVRSGSGEEGGGNDTASASTVDESGGGGGGGAASAPAAPAGTAGDIWFNICYEDGDKEDVSFHELVGMMMDARAEDAREAAAAAAAAAEADAGGGTGGDAGADINQSETAQLGSSGEATQQEQQQQDEDDEQDESAAAPGDGAGAGSPAGLAAASSVDDDSSGAGAEDEAEAEDERNDEEFQLQPQPKRVALARPVFPGILASSGASSPSSLGSSELQEEEEKIQLYHLQSAMPCHAMNDY